MMDAPKLMWGAEHWLQWLMVAGTLAAVLLALLVLGYWKVGSTTVRVAAATLKTIAILILALILLDPLSTGSHAKQRANQFVVLTDNSQSMTLRDADSSATRGDQFKKLVGSDSPGKDAPWLDKIGRDFDLREFAFDSQLRPVDSFKNLAFDGHASDLGRSLESLIKRYQGRPLAGIMVFTDGSATDADAVARVVAMGAAKGDALKVPPIYPVLMGRKSTVKDISLERIAVSQTNFEDAPVTVTADVTTTGMAGRTISAQLTNAKGELVEEQQDHVDKDGDPLAIRFRIKPDEKADDGLSFYTVRVSEKGMERQFDDPRLSDEATLANNSRMAAVDRGKGPYRILYVAGRMNWEYKFLNRALATDDQTQLSGLIRIAKREPKFNFIGHAATGETVNPLFSGFNSTNPEDAAQFDQPVIVPVGATDQKDPLRTFPKTAEELFSYNAIIIDDMEAEFFTPDQQQLIKDFVRQRGGGLLMLGGVDTFKDGKYDKTVIGDMLPVYIEDPPVYKSSSYRISLTHEGMLSSWLRLRSDEDSEDARIDNMPGSFQALTPVRGTKPGATILARAMGDAGDYQPALVEQRFGKGRVDALLIGDMWKWEMNRQTNTDTDFEKSWRQMIRWLVSDVPKPIDVSLDNTQHPEDADGTVRLIVQVRDKTYTPQDNATVDVKITPPDGQTVEMRAEPSEKQSGEYVAVYVPRQPGAYRAAIHVAGIDGKAIGDTRAGWTSDPAAEEFRDLQPNATLLERLAKSTGGEMIDASHLGAFADGLPLRQAQVMEPYEEHYWHQSWVFLLAIGLLGAEWGLRRIKGLP